jgi:UDP-3-O-[3-hydroxymyristoyl] glucosamine N-acyltransferase
MGGTPAVPFKEWARQLAMIKRLTQKEGRAGSDDEDRV